ncbi:MAG: hypothetical protein IH594_09955 [Bacteroidales bacterium]|nr:hypothetical protein [Bacteroidales bacterium]
MRANRKNLILIAFLFVNIGLSGQIELSNFYQDYLKAKSMGPAYSDKIVGTPYGNKEFMNAQVFMKGTGEPVHGSMRYNNYTDEMEFRMEKDGQILILDKKNTLDSILLDNKTYQYLPYLKEKNENIGFFVRLTNSEYKLYMKSPKKFQEEKVPKSGYEDYVPPSFVDLEDEFYVDFGDGLLVYIPQRSKKITELFLEKGFENREMQKVRYTEEDLREYVEGMNRVNL